MRKEIKGAMLAATVATLFAASGAVADHHEKASGGSVKCAGGNACKGKGACGGASHDCAGKNECKGKGWIQAASAEECKSKGGTVEEGSSKH